MKRLISAALALFVLMSVPVFAGAAAEPVFYSDKVIAYAEGVAGMIEDFGKIYTFGNDGITNSELQQVMSLVFNENPHFVHLHTNYAFSYDVDKTTGEWIVYDVRPKYTMDKAEYAAALAEVEAWVDRIAALADPGFTDLEYALFFHDYLVKNYSYDNSLNVFNVYNMIKTGTGVCQAYSYAYAMLLMEVGVEVSWATSPEMNHLWNLVKVDGEWYHVDATWDDPNGRSAGSVIHSYFLKSDRAISSKDGGHYGWLSRYACTSEKYDGLWLSGVSSAFGYTGSKWYAVADGDLVTLDVLTGEGRVVADMNFVWQVWNSANTYVASYGGAAAIGGKVYFYGPDKLWCYDPSDGSVSEIWACDTSVGYIYGIAEDLGDDGISGIGGNVELKITVGTAPGESVRVDTFTVSAVNVRRDAGDVNKDGKVNLTDVALMLRHIAGWDVTVDSDEADADGNGKVNITDATLVLRIIAGWY